jgi:Rha family phage regulatory protein
MNNIVKKELTLDSREVAEMVEKNHKELLRDIRTYEGYLGESNFALTDFFIPSTYVSIQNKELPNYQITKKGCEFIAHKLTGQKGALFTATYINRFHEMEQALIEKEEPLQIDSKFLYQLAGQLEEKEKLIAEQKREIEHKTEVIKGATDDIDIYTKRNVLNKVVGYKGANFAERWNELYDRFREVYSIDLKARCEGYNLKQKKKKDQLSTIKYAEKFGYIDDLYKIALKLYETDINEILKHLQKIA